MSLALESLYAILQNAHPVVEPFSTTDWYELQRLGIYHDLEALLWQRLRHRSLPPAIAAAWQQSYYRTGLLNTAFQEHLAPILDAAQHHKIPVVVLKGMALLTSTYSNVALRPMVDIDLLVQRHQVASMWAILSEFGHLLQPLTSRQRALLHRNSGELKLAHYQKQYLIELHWWLYAGAWSQHAGLLTSNIHWQRLRKVTIAGATALRLHPHDELFHLAHHAVVSNQLGQAVGRMVLDLDRLIRELATTLVWSAIWREARMLGLQTVLWLALSLAKAVCKTPLPFTLDTYAPPRGRRLLLRRLTQVDQIMQGDDLRFKPWLRHLFLLLLVDHPVQRATLMVEALAPHYHQ